MDATYHWNQREKAIESYPLASPEGQTWEEAATRAAESMQAAYAVVRGGNGSMLSALSGDKPEAEPCGECNEWATDWDPIANGPRCPGHVTKCKQTGCGRPATRWAASQAGVPGHPSLGEDAEPFCEEHARERMLSGNPEYEGECPHCGCLFGIN